MGTTTYTHEDLSTMTMKQLAAISVTFGVKVDPKAAKDKAVTRIMRAMNGQGEAEAFAAGAVPSLDKEPGDDAPAGMSPANPSANVAAEAAARGMTVQRYGGLGAEREARKATKDRERKERSPFNTTARYIVNTLAFHRTPMTRGEIDRACRLRGGSIAGHAVKTRTSRW